MTIFEQIAIGGDRNFAYLVGDQAAGVGAVVDPGYNGALIQQRLDQLGLRLGFILATHSHPDHIGAVAELRKATGAPLVAHPDLRLEGGPPQIPMADGQIVHVGAIPVAAIHCPGHCRDSVAFLVDGTKLISGDELFVGKVGGTPTPAMARRQHQNLHEKLMILPDGVEVWPGHDFGLRPHSTIGQERRSNPFLLQATFEAFWGLKENWAQYKIEHGIK